MADTIPDGHTLTEKMHDGKEITFRRPLGGDISTLFGKLKAKVETNKSGEVVVNFDSDVDPRATCIFIAGSLRTWWRDEPITAESVYALDYAYYRQITVILVNAHFDVSDGEAEKN